MDTTIAAIATPVGEGGIGIVRISGDLALPILRQIYKTKKNQSPSEIIPRRVMFGYIVDEEKEKVLDEAMVAYMKAPNSYTGEDVVEIQCHGSFVSLRKILELVLKKGAFLAEKGEFTKRAFLNGRLDLSQAEAVIDIIKAKTEKGFDVALSQLEGGLSSKIRDIRKDLADLLSLVIVNIEYPDEDIEEVTYETLISDLDKISKRISNLIASAATGRVIRDGLKITIIGKPNVGKSSLMNSLLNEQRAIVTEIPGTTRDTIEEFVTIDDIPVKLIDTAGIRETEDRIEKIGIEKSKESFNQADLVLFLIDSSDVLAEEDFEIMKNLGDKKGIVLLNKVDLEQMTQEAQIRELLPGCEFLSTSALTGFGIDELKQKIKEMVYEGVVSADDHVLVTNMRHLDLLRQSFESLQDASQMARLNEALDFIEVDIHRSWELLGEITGESVSEDIISEVFSRFCLGK